MCSGCQNALYNFEETICTNCIYNLPATGFELIEKNLVAQLFWGRIHVHAATAFLYFHKEGIVQKMMHSLKYQDNQAIGVLLGQRFGEVLKTSAIYTDVDLVIPVPLHPSKLKKRGYNQSECIAQGISNTMENKLSTHNLLRISASESQTRKGRFDRWLNVNEIFSIANPEELEHKHVLLIDDVITTGSTIEGCISAIYKHTQNVKVSVATLAMAT